MTSASLSKVEFVVTIISMPSFILFNIYLFYGLVFFAIGCVVVFRNFKYSQLKIASTLWALALFGFLHAFHEWSELYVILFNDIYSEEYESLIIWLRLAKLFLSYIALMIFAWQVLSILNRVLAKLGHVLILSVLVGYFSLVFLKWHSEPMSLAVFMDISHMLRLWIGLGSASLAGIGLMFYGHSLKQQTKSYGGYFIGCGLGLLAYGWLSGVVHTDWHHSVPVMRTLAAAVILLCLYQALRVFDIEREQATEAKLKRAIEADKYNAIGQLAMGVAHEVNNPLASATLALDLLERQPLNEAQKDYVQRVRLGVNRAASISKELLGYARPADEKKVSLNLSNVLTSTVALLAHKTKGYRVKVDCDKQIALVGQKIKLEELFINLIANAIDASEPGQEVYVSASSQDNCTQITVSDEGSGMDMATQERAKEPFFSTKSVGEGTGLGLALCDKIVKLHSGQMSIVSQLGQGTQISITFYKEAN